MNKKSFFSLTYVKESFLKFKNDVLSKGIYDILKYLIVTYILLAIVKYIPTIKKNFELEISLTVWTILTLSIILIAISFVISFVIFNNKYKSILAKTQIDDLTGLKNYKALEKDLDNLQKNRDNKEEPVSIILFDIDNFKKFNDENNYEIADKILKKIGGILAKDSRITDETYRYFMRGDEFLIIARQTSLSNAKIAADRKRALIADSQFEIDGNHFNLTVSCGVTEYNKDDFKTDVLDRVSKALQNAKRKQNKNCTEIII